MSDCRPDCGEWEDLPEGPDGQCTPRRLKQTCDAPTAYLNTNAESCTDTCPEGSVSEPITVVIGVGTVNSPYSTSNANDRAESLACQQAVAARALSPCLYPNSEQTCEDVCPEGTEGGTISVTVDARDPRFDSPTVEIANSLALAYACEQVEILRNSSPCVVPEVDTNVPISYTCRSKTGLGIIIGCPEFGTPSVPPRLYRRTYGGGQSTNTSFSDSGCTIPIAFSTCTYDSFYEWDAITGLPSSGGQTTCVNNLGDVSVFPGVTNCFGTLGPPAGDCLGFWVFSSKTLALSLSTGNCCLQGSVYQKGTASTGYVELTEEDTEDDAEVRAMIDLEYDTGGDCADHTGEREQRVGTDTQFDFRKGEVQITIGSVEDPLLIGHEYQITIELSRRALGSADPFLVFSSAQFNITADEAVETSDWVDIPNSSGYEVRAETISAVDLAA